MEKKEEFIRVGTTLYKIVNQSRIDGGYVKKGSFIGFWKQKSHSSIGRFLHALLRNAKNTLSSQREIPLDTLCKREQKPNSFGLCRVQQWFICIINPVSRCHRQKEET